MGHSFAGSSAALEKHFPLHQMLHNHFKQNSAEEIDIFLLVLQEKLQQSIPVPD